MTKRRSPPKSTWKFKRQELCQCYTISVSFAIRYKSHIYVFFVPMENSNAVVVFSCFNLFYHWKRSTPPILLKSEIDSTSYKIPKLVQIIIMFTLPQIFKQKKTVLLKELVKRFVCVCARKTVPSRRQMVSIWKWREPVTVPWCLEWLLGLAATHRQYFTMKRPWQKLTRQKWNY